MKILKLSQNKITLVDDEDYQILNQWKWFYSSRGYAVRHIFKDEKRTLLYLHRFIINTPDGQQTDHINGNKLDNRRSNLRICTQTENNRNRKIGKNSSTGFKGVSWDKKIKRFVAYTKLNKKPIFLGTYFTAEDAARAYDRFAKEHFGEYARFNL